MSGRTWNNYRRDFHVAFTWAVDQKYLLTNPAGSVPEAQEGIGLDEKKERIEIFLRARSPKSLKNGGKLPRIVGHAVDDAVDFGAKAAA